MRNNTLGPDRPQGQSAQTPNSRLKMSADEWERKKLSSLAGNRLREGLQASMPTNTTTPNPRRGLDQVVHAVHSGKKLLEYPSAPSEADVSKWVDQRPHPPSMVVLKDFHVRPNSARPAAHGLSPRIRGARSPRATTHQTPTGSRSAKQGLAHTLPLLGTVSLSHNHMADDSVDLDDYELRGTSTQENEMELNAMRSVLGSWASAYEAETSNFASRAVFVEMRLRQALSSSTELGVPNLFRCAIVCDAWERVAPLTGRLSGVLGLIWTELLRSALPCVSDLMT